MCTLGSNLPAWGLRGGVLVAALGVIGPASASTLLMNSGSGPDALDAQAALAGTGLFAPADLPVRADPSTPTLPELQAHDVVLLWTGAPWADAGGLGDVLADYIDSGGAVLLAAPALVAGQGPEGRFAAEGYSPVVSGAAGAVAGDVDLGASDADHPALLGLADVRFPDAGQGDPGLAPAGELVAVDSAGHLVAASTCDRSVIAVNLRPQDLALGEPQASADAATFLAQALLATQLDAPPVASLDGPWSVSEGDVVGLDGAGSSAGDLGPLSFAWDLDADGAFDDATGSPASFDATGFDGPGTAPVALRVTDRCGRSADASGLVTLLNAPPTLSFVGLAPAGSIGEALAYSVAAEDPGADVLDVVWTWGDGSPTSAGPAVSHTWTAPGTWSVSVAVGDGDAAPVVAGGTTFVTNPGPSLAVIAADEAVEEGAPAAFEVAAADALGGGVELSWDFGDASPPAAGADLRSVGHAWADDGLFTVTVVATDALGATASLDLAVAVSNVAPSPSAAPPGTGMEGAPYTAALTAEDPGGDDAIWSLVLGPAGLTIDAAGSVAWTPTWEQAGATHAVQALVQDGDGGAAILDWAVAVAWIDADGDGLPDTWEAMVGLDPTGDDSAADLDGDGLSNAEEFAAGTAPDVANVPGPPTPLSPPAGAEVAESRPELRVLAAGDPDGDALTYTFEVYGDAPLTALLEAGEGVLASGGEAAWAPVNALPEDADAFWRARASDAHGAGPWTAARSLHVDATNSPPPVPMIVSPDGSTVETTTVALLATAGPDPEGDALALVFRVAGPDGVLEVGAVEGTDGWVAVLSSLLEDDVDYTWTAESVDARGGASGETAPAPFHLDATNRVPAPPTVLDPLEGGETADARQGLRVAVVADPDGDPLVVRVEAAQDPSFASAVALGLVAPVDGEAEAASDVDLPENRLVWLRARTEDDRGGRSAWVVDRGFVNAVEEAPPAPQIVEPSPEQVVEPDGLVLRWAVVADPDGDAVRYEAALAADESAPEDALWTAEVEDADDGSERSAAPDAPLEPGGYRVFVRAVDEGGAAGPWASRRVVVPGPEPGEPLDLGAGAGAGWACSHAPGSGVLLVLLTGARRRRRRAGR